MKTTNKNATIQNQPETTRLSKHFDLGCSYCGKGNHHSAIKAFVKAIQTKPDSAESYYGLGVTYECMGFYEQAIHAYKQAVGVKPDYPEAHYALGVTHKKHNEIGRAHV